jgi:hypothetical protein
MITYTFENGIVNGKLKLKVPVEAGFGRLTLVKRKWTNQGSNGKRGELKTSIPRGGSLCRIRISAEVVLIKH